MRMVKYRITGTRQPNFTADGTPGELLKWVMGFPPSRDVPPLAAMNDVFRKGFRSGGFNGDTHWEPFELSSHDYAEVVAELLADEEAGYRLLAAPDWVATELDWMAYVGSHHQGIPLEPYRDLLCRYDRLVNELDAARAKGNKVAVFQRTVQLTMTARKMLRFLKRYAVEEV
jgi:hypothetical protein